MSSSEDHPLKKMLDTSFNWFGVDSREFSSDKLLGTVAHFLDPELFKPAISSEDAARLKALGQTLNQAEIGALDESGLILETQKNEATKKFWSSFLQKREEFTRSGFSVPAFQKENPLYGLVGHKDSYLQSLLVFYEENGVPLFSYDKQLRLLTETTDWSGARLSKEEARKVIQYWIGKYETVSSRYALYGRMEAREFSEGRKYLGQEMRKRDPQKALELYEQASKLSPQDRALSLEVLEFQWKVLKENRGDFFQVPSDFLAEVNRMTAGEAEDFLQAKALRLRGEIAIVAGEKEEGHSYFQRSLELADRLYDSEKVLYSGFRLGENPEESRYSLTNLSVLTEEIRSLSGRVESEVLRGESLLRVNETRKALVEFKNHHASLQDQAGSKEANFEQTNRWSAVMARFEKVTEGIEVELKQTESSLQKDLSQFVPSVSTCDGISVRDVRIEIEKSRLLAQVRRELAILHPDAKSEESYYSALTIWRALLSSASPVSDLELNPPIKDQMLELTKELMLFRSKVEKHPELFALVGRVNAITTLERSQEIRRVFSEQRNAQLRPLLEKLKPKERKELESLLTRFDEKADQFIEELVSKGEKVLESEIGQKLERLFQEIYSDSVFKKIVSFHPFLKFIIDQETKILKGLGILKEEDSSRTPALALGERRKELLSSIHFEISCLNQGFLNQFSEVEQMRLSGFLSRIVEEGDLESAERYLSKSGLEDYLKKSGEADVLFSRALEVRQRVEKLNSPEGKKLRLVDKEGRTLTPQEIELFKEQSLSMEESYILSALSHYEELGEGLKVQRLKEWSERELLPRLEERERARFRQSVNGMGMGKELAEAKLLAGAYVEASFRNDDGLNFAVLPKDITDEDRFIRWLQHQAGQQDGVLWNDPYRQTLEKPEVVELLKKVFRAERSGNFVSYTKEERADFREVLLRFKRELINPLEGKELGSWGKLKVWLLGPELKAFVAHHSSNKGGRALLQEILRDEKSYTLGTRVALGYKVAAQLGDEGWVDESRARSAENLFAEAAQTIESAQFLLEVAEVRHEEIEKNQEKNKYSEIVEKNKKRWGAEVRMESRLAALADAIKKDSNWKGSEDQEWNGTKVNKVREIALKKLDLLLKEASELESKGEKLSVSEREKALLIFNKKVAEFAKSDLLPDRSSELKDFFNLLPVRKRQPVSDLTRYTRELDFANNLGHEVIIASTRFPIQNEKLQKLEKQVQGLEEALLTLELSLIHQYKEGGWVVRGIANAGEALGIGHLEKLVKAINAIKQIRLNLAQKIEEASKEFATDEKGLENRVEDLLQGALGEFFKLSEEGGAISEVREVVGETEFKTLVDLAQTTVEMMVVGGVAGALMKGGKWLSAIRKAQSAAKVLEAGAVAAESGGVLAKGIEGIESLEAVANAFGEAAKGVKFHWTIELSSAVAAGNVEATRFIFKELGGKMKEHLEHHLGEAVENFLMGGFHSAINPLFQQLSGGYSDDQWEFYDRFVAFISTGLSMFITKFIPEGGNGIRWGMRYQLRAVSELWGRAGAVGLLKWTTIGMLKWGADLAHAATVETLEELIDGIAAAVCKGERVDEDLIKKTTRSVVVGAAAMHKGQKLMSAVFHAVSGSGHADIFQKVAEEAGLDHLPKQAIKGILKAMVEHAFQQAMAEGKDLGEIEEEDVERILKNLFSVIDQLVKNSGMQGKGLETFRLDLIQKALLSGLNAEQLQKRATFVLEPRARIEKEILTPLVEEANLKQPHVQNTVNWFIGILFSNSFQGAGNRRAELTDLLALEQIKSEVDRWSKLAVSMAPDLHAALDTYLGKEESGSAERAYLTLLFFTDRFNSKGAYSYENKIDEIDSELQKIQKGLQAISKEFGVLVNELLGCLKLPEKEIPKAREVLVHWLLEIRKAKTKEEREKALRLIDEKAWVAAGGEANLLAPMQTVICRFVDQQISEEALKAAEVVIGKIAGFRQQWNRDRMEAAKREEKRAAGFNAEREGDGKSNGEGSEGFLNEEKKEKLENNVAVTKTKSSLANRTKLGQIAQRGSRWLEQHPAIFIGIACAISVAKPVIGLMAQHFGMDLGVGFSPDLHPLQSLAEGVSGLMVYAGVRTAGNEEGTKGEERNQSGSGDAENFQQGEDRKKTETLIEPAPIPITVKVDEEIKPALHSVSEETIRYCDETALQLEDERSVLKGKVELETRYRETLQKLKRGEIDEVEARIELNSIIRTDYFNRMKEKYGVEVKSYPLSEYLDQMKTSRFQIRKIPSHVLKFAERFPSLPVYVLPLNRLGFEEGFLNPRLIGYGMKTCLQEFGLYEPDPLQYSPISPEGRAVFWPEALLLNSLQETYGDQTFRLRLTNELSSDEQIFEMALKRERPFRSSPIPVNLNTTEPAHPAIDAPHEYYHLARVSGYADDQQIDAVHIARAFQPDHISANIFREVQGRIAEHTHYPRNDEHFHLDIFGYIKKRFADAQALTPEFIENFFERLNLQIGESYPRRQEIFDAFQIVFKDFIKDKKPSATVSEAAAIGEVAVSNFDEKTKSSAGIEKFCQETLDQLKNPNSAFKGHTDLRKQYRQIIQKFQTGKITKRDCLVQVMSLMQQRFFRRFDRGERRGVSHSQVRIQDYIIDLQKRKIPLPEWLKVTVEKKPDLLIDILKDDLSIRRDGEEGFLEELNFIKSLLKNLSTMLRLPIRVLSFSDVDNSHLLFFSSQLLMMALEELYQSETADYQLTNNLGSTEEVLEIEAADGRPILLSPLRQKNVHGCKKTDPYLTALHDLLHLFAFSHKDRVTRKAAVIIGKAIFNLSEELKAPFLNNEELSHIIELAYVDSYASGLNFYKDAFERLKSEGLFQQVQILTVYQQLVELLEIDPDKEEILKIYRTVFEFESSSSKAPQDSSLMTGVRELVLGNQSGANSSLLIGGLALGYAVNPLLGIAVFAVGVGIYLFDQFVSTHLTSSTDSKSDIQSADSLIKTYQSQLDEEREFVQIDFLDSPHANWSSDEKREIRELLNSVPYPLRKQLGNKPIRFSKGNQLQFDHEENVTAEYFVFENQIVFYKRFFEKSKIEKLSAVAHELTHPIAAFSPSIQSRYITLSNWKTGFNLQDAKEVGFFSYIRLYWTTILMACFPDQSKKFYRKRDNPVISSAQLVFIDPHHHQLVSFEETMIPRFNESNYATFNEEEELPEAVGEAISNPTKFRYHCLIEPHQKGLSDEQIARFQKKWDLVRGEIVGLSDALIQAIVEKLLIEVDIDLKKAQKIIKIFFHQAQLTTTAIQFESLRQEFIEKLKAEKQIHSSEIIEPIQNNSISLNSAVDNRWQTVILDDDGISFCNESLDQLNSPDCVLEDSPEENYYPKREYEKILRGVLAQETSLAEAIVQLDDILREDYIRESVRRYPMIRGRKKFTFRNGLKGEADCLILQAGEFPEDLVLFYSFYEKVFLVETSITPEPTEIIFPTAKESLTVIGNRLGYHLKPMTRKASMIEAYEMLKNKTRPAWITPKRIKEVHEYNNVHPYLGGNLHDISHIGQMAESLNVRGISEAQGQILLEIFEILIQTPLREECLTNEGLGIYLLDVATVFNIALSSAFRIVKRFSPSTQIVLEIDRQLRARFSEQSDHDIIYEFRDNFPDISFPDLEISSQSSTSTDAAITSDILSSESGFIGAEKSILGVIGFGGIILGVKGLVALGVGVAAASAIVPVTAFALGAIAVIYGKGKAAGAEGMIASMKMGVAVLVESTHQTVWKKIVLPQIDENFYQDSLEELNFPDCVLKDSVEENYFPNSKYRLVLLEAMNGKFTPYNALVKLEAILREDFIRLCKKSGKVTSQEVDFQGDKGARLFSELDVTELGKDLGYGYSLAFLMRGVWGLLENYITSRLSQYIGTAGVDSRVEIPPLSFFLKKLLKKNRGRNYSLEITNKLHSLDGIRKRAKKKIRPLQITTLKQELHGSKPLHPYVAFAHDIYHVFVAEHANEETSQDYSLIGECIDQSSADFKQLCRNSDVVMSPVDEGVFAENRNIHGFKHFFQIVKRLNPKREGVLSFYSQLQLQFSERNCEVIQAFEEVFKDFLTSFQDMTAHSVNDSFQLHLISSASTTMINTAAELQPHRSSPNSVDYYITNLHKRFIDFCLKKRNLQKLKITYEQISLQDALRGTALEEDSKIYLIDSENKKVDVISLVKAEINHSDEEELLFSELKSLSKYLCSYSFHRNEQTDTIEEKYFLLPFSFICFLLGQRGLAVRIVKDFSGSEAIQSLAQGRYPIKIPTLLSPRKEVWINLLEIYRSIRAAFDIGSKGSKYLQGLQASSQAILDLSSQSEHAESATHLTSIFLSLIGGKSIRMNEMLAPLGEFASGRKIQFRETSLLGVASENPEGIFQLQMIDWRKFTSFSAFFYQIALRLSIGFREGKYRSIRSLLETIAQMRTMYAILNPLLGEEIGDHHTIGRSQNLTVFGKKRNQLHQGITRLGTTPYLPFTSEVKEAFVNFRRIETGKARKTVYKKEIVLRGEKLVIGTFKSETFLSEKVSEEIRFIPCSLETIEKILSHIETLYEKLLNSNLDPKETIKIVAEIHWWLSHAQIYRRGSALIADVTVKTILFAHAILPAHWANGISPDIKALCTSLEEYIEIYPKLFRRTEDAVVARQIEGVINHKITLESTFDPKQVLQTNILSVLAVSAMTFGSVVTVIIALGGLTVVGYKKGKELFQKRIVDPWNSIRSGMIAVSKMTANPFNRIITEVTENNRVEVENVKEEKSEKGEKNLIHIVPPFTPSKETSASLENMRMEGELMRLSLKGTDAVILLIELIRNRLDRLSFNGTISEDQNISTIVIYISELGESEIFWDDTQTLGNNDTVNGSPAIEIIMILQKKIEGGREKVILSTVLLSDSPAEFQRTPRAYNVGVQLKSLEGENLLDDIEEIDFPKEASVFVSKEKQVVVPLALMKDVSGSSTLLTTEIKTDSCFNFSRGKIARGCSDLLPLFCPIFINGISQMKFQEREDLSGQIANVVVLLTEDRDFEVKWDDKEELNLIRTRTIENKRAYRVWIQILKQTKLDQKRKVTIDAVSIPQEVFSSRLVHSIALQMESDLEGKTLLEDSSFDQSRSVAAKEKTITPLDSHVKTVPRNKKITGEYPAIYQINDLTAIQREKVIRSIGESTLASTIYRTIQDYLLEHADHFSLSLRFNLTLNRQGEASSRPLIKMGKYYPVNVVLMRSRHQKGKLVFEIKEISCEKEKKTEDIQDDIFYEALKFVQQAEYIIPSEKNKPDGSPKPPYFSDNQKGFSQVETMGTIAVLTFPVAVGTVFGLTTGLIAATSIITTAALIVGVRALYANVKNFNVQICIDQLKAGLTFVTSNTLFSLNRTQQTFLLQWTASISFLTASAPLFAKAAVDVVNWKKGDSCFDVIEGFFPMFIPVIFAGMIPFRPPYSGKGRKAKENIYSFLRGEFATRKQDARILWKALMHNDSAIRVLFVDLDEKMIQRVDYNPEEKKLLDEREIIKDLLDEIDEIEKEVTPLLKENWEEDLEESNWKIWEDIKKRLEEKSKLTIEKIDVLRRKCINYRILERKKEYLSRRARKINMPTTILSISEDSKASTVESVGETALGKSSQSAFLDSIHIPNKLSLNDPKIEFRKINFKELEEWIAVIRGIAIGVAALRNAPENLRTEEIKKILLDETDQAVLNIINRIRQSLNQFRDLLNKEWEKNKIKERVFEAHSFFENIEMLKKKMKEHQERLEQLQKAINREFEKQDIFHTLPLPISRSKKTTLSFGIVNSATQALTFHGVGENYALYIGEDVDGELRVGTSEEILQKHIMIYLLPGWAGIQAIRLRSSNNLIVYYGGKFWSENFPTILNMNSTIQLGEDGIIFKLGRMEKFTNPQKDYFFIVNQVPDAKKTLSTTMSHSIAILGGVPLSFEARRQILNFHKTHLLQGRIESGFRTASRGATWNYEKDCFENSQREIVVLDRVRDKKYHQFLFETKNKIFELLLPQSGYSAIQINPRERTFKKEAFLKALELFLLEVLKSFPPKFSRDLKGTIEAFRALEVWSDVFSGKEVYVSNILNMGISACRHLPYLLHEFLIDSGFLDAQIRRGYLRTSHPNPTKFEEAFMSHAWVWVDLSITRLTDPIILDLTHAYWGSMSQMIKIGSDAKKYILESDISIEARKLGFFISS